MKCCKKQCDAEGTVRFHRSMYCELHARVRQMGIACRHDRKPCPDYQHLEFMAIRLSRKGMLCPLCGVKMNWRLAGGRTTCVSLQHDRSGEFKLICLSCNVKHGQLPGDVYYEVPAGHKWCAGCSRALSLENFYVSRTTAQSVLSRCKECCKAANTQRKRINGKRIRCK